MLKRKHLAGLVLVVVALLVNGCGGGDNNIEVYHVGGNVSGLLGTGLVLQDNAAAELPITSDGAYRFPTALTNGSNYAITIKSQPGIPNQGCTISNTTGVIAGSNITNVNVTCTANFYTVGGNVNGLNSSGLVLQNNGADNLDIAFNGAFSFSTPLVDTSAYTVTILSQPNNPIQQTCAISNGSGVLAGSNVTSVSIDCVTNTYTIGGTVAGLSGSGLVLQNNAGDDLAIPASGIFTFPTPLDDGDAYSVTIKTQPAAPNQLCTVTNDSGLLAGSNVTNVTVTCVNAYAVGGTVTGLTGAGLVLQNNGADDLAISANGSFTFPQLITDNNSYEVTVSTHPDSPVQLCTVANDSGTVSGTDISNVTVNCVDADSIGGTVNGLAGSGLVLQNNGDDDLAIITNGNFRFVTPLANGSSYDVTVLTQPASPEQNCTVTNASGTVSGTNITNVAVDCVFTNAWVWQDGSDTINPPGDYGTLGTPAASNFPPGRKDAINWTDSGGVQWLFGGTRFDPDFDPNANPPVPPEPDYLNDLWTYDGGIWTWVGGSSALNPPGNYGTLGTAAAANIPGARARAVSWTDSGEQWLFGGLGFDSVSELGFLNDLWKFDGSEWTWMGGSNLANQPGNYGTQGTPDAANIPAGRRGSVSWQDSLGNLWLFGGLQFDPNYTYDPNVDPPPSPPYEGYMNDLWKFDGNGEWTWIAGSATPNQAGTYGTRGTPAAANIPGGREGAVRWQDSTGMWLFGGWGIDEGGNTGYLNDLWKFDGNEWTWVAGNKLANQPGIYGTQGTADSANIPGGREGAVSWQDGSGNLWLMGGTGFDASSNQDYLNDLWKFDGNEWTWVGGSNGINQPGNYGQNRLYLNDGSGSFSATGTAIGSEIDGTLSVARGDVDGDGDLDLVAGNWGHPNKLYLNDGSGGFASGTALGSETDQTNSVALGDVDGDGDLDLVTGNDSQTNKLYLNDGSGSFSATGSNLGSETDATASVALGDVNGDGDLDLVAGNFSQTNRLYLNDGSGGFAASGTVLGSETDNTWSVALGDVDGDGELDLVAGNYAQTNRLYLNDGSGGFAASGTALGSEIDATVSVALGDVDGDGDLDLVAGNYGIQGTADPANIPGGREGAMTWQDSAGEQWLFGGWGLDAIGDEGDLNDLWRYLP